MTMSTTCSRVAAHARTIHVAVRRPGPGVDGGGKRSQTVAALDTVPEG